MPFDLKNILKGNKEDKECKKDGIKCNSKDLIARDTANNKLTFFSFDAKSKIQSINNSNSNSNSTNNTKITSKNKVNIFELFKKDKDNKEYNHSEKAKEDDLTEDLEDLTSNKVVDFIKSINKKSSEKKNCSNNQKKDVTDEVAVETKNTNLNIFKKFFLKKNSYDQPAVLIDSPLDRFRPIDLPSLNKRVDWNKRYDMKFVAHISTMVPFMETLSTDYLILEHGGNRILRYTTEYFDTSDYSMFHQHQSGCERRYKIRTRRYDNENKLWMEIKEKNNGQTFKHRTFNPTPEEINTFVTTNTPYTQNNLNPMFIVYYERTTFIHRTLPLKITIDKNMKIGKGNDWTYFNDLIILELKTENSTPSYAVRLVESKGFERCSISKYCIGMVTLNPELKQHAHNLRPTLSKIKKINKKIKI